MTTKRLLKFLEAQQLVVDYETAKQLMKVYKKGKK